MPAEHFSANKHWRLTVIPRAGDGLTHFSAKVEGKPLPGDGPRATLARRDGRRWTTVWQSRLVNEVAPPEALVSDAGRHVVTIGNWFGNLGPHEIVIYDATGRMVRSLALTDLLSEAYIAALPHSVRSIQWSTEETLSADGRSLEIAVQSPAAEFATQSAGFRLAIDLASAAPRVLDPVAWCAAQAKVAPKLAEMAAGARETYRFLTEPLVGTAITNDRGWQDYLWEAVARLAPLDEDGEPGFAWDTVLRLRSAKNYQASEQRVKNSLSGEEPFDELSFAAFDPPALVALFHRLPAPRPAGALKGKRIYVFLPAAYHAGVTAAFAGTGATLVLHDPAVPIPRRASGIARFAKPTDYTKLDARSPVAVDCPVAFRPLTTSAPLREAAQVVFGWARAAANDVSALLTRLRLPGWSA